MSGAYATSQTTVGIAKEVTRGVSVNPNYWAKVKSPAYKPNLMVLEDDTLQGSMVTVYDAIPGLRYDGHGWTTFPYLDILPLLVQAELGSPDAVTTAPTNTTLAANANVGDMSIQTNGPIPANRWITIGHSSVSGQITTLETHYTTSLTGTTAPYTVGLQYAVKYDHSSSATDGSADITGLTGHDFSLLNNAGIGNQPPSMTITDYDGEQWRQLAAAQLDKFTFKMIPSKLIEIDLTWFANPSITPSTPVPSFTTVQAVPAWSTDVALNGVALNYVESIELDLMRGVKPIEAFTGTEAYYEYFAGPIQTKGKMVVVEQAGSPQLTNYESGFEQSIDISFYDRRNGYGARFHSSNAIFTTAELTRSKEWVEVTFDILLLPTTADATAGGVSPINISIGNGTTTQY